MDRIKILFLCTGNSCRSQMAEGFARALRPEDIEAYSAGIEPKGVDPRAVAVMVETGIDISGQRSKNLDEFDDMDFDYVVTLCDNARESCPMYFGTAKKAHFGFEDPPALALNASSEEEALSHYRRVRDRIREFVLGLPGNLDISER